jgi:hypothetical protein
MSLITPKPGSQWMHTAGGARYLVVRALGPTNNSDYGSLPDGLVLAINAVHMGKTTSWESVGGGLLIYSLSLWHKLFKLAGETSPENLPEADPVDPVDERIAAYKAANGLS